MERLKNFRDTIDYDGMGNQGRIGRQIYKKRFIRCFIYFKYNTH